MATVLAEAFRNYALRAFGYAERIATTSAKVCGGTRCGTVALVAHFAHCIVIVEKMYLALLLFLVLFGVNKASLGFSSIKRMKSK